MSALKEALKQGNDFIADLLALYATFENGDEVDELGEALKPAFEVWPGRKYLQTLSQKDIQDLLLQARNLTLDRLVKKE